ncbi:MAG: hypothetical protein AAGG68_27830 [Bacteroidota bacterium]
MDIAQENNRTTASQNKRERKEIVDKISYRKGITNGIFLGVTIAIFSLLVELAASSEAAAYFKPAKYLFMLGAFYYTLKNYKKTLPKGEIFKRGAVLGIYMSITTALVVFGLMALFQVVLPGVEFSKYTEEIDSASKAIFFDWILLVETFVFGIIISFIVLQGIKDTNRTK